MVKGIYFNSFYFVFYSMIFNEKKIQMVCMRLSTCTCIFESQFNEKGLLNNESLNYFVS